MESELERNIQSLSGSQVAEAVKNLGIALQYHWQKQVDDEEVRTTLESVHAEGESELLRQSIISGTHSSEEMERWGKGLLRYAAADPDLRPYVEEAVNDALETGVKVFDLATLIVLGVVLVVIKWRPSKFVRKKDEITIEWKDNDTQAVSDLAKMIGGDPGTGGP